MKYYYLLIDKFKLSQKVDSQGKIENIYKILTNFISGGLDISLWRSLSLDMGHLVELFS